MAAIYATPEALAKLSEPDPEFAELLATTAQPKIELSYPVVQAIRQQTLAAEQTRTAQAIAAGAKEETITIVMRDGFHSETRIHRPKDAAPNSPLIVLLYGGGFFMGNNMQPGTTARHLTKLYAATVACISYRLAPEHPWPAAHHDAWDSLIWLASHASDLGVDLSTGFIVGGASAGGNISAVLAQKSLNEPSALAAPLTGVWMDVSMVFKDVENVPKDHRALHLSHAQNAGAPGLLSAQAVTYIRSVVRGDGWSPDFSPVNAERAGEGMPRVFIQVAGMDPFRDDGLVYERMLREKGWRRDCVCMLVCRMGMLLCGLR
ncbi:hypothetical protein Q7P37_006391 [Cladosporium fusiforme]